MHFTLSNIPSQKLYNLLYTSLSKGPELYNIVSKVLFLTLKGIFNAFIQTGYLVANSKLSILGSLYSFLGIYFSFVIIIKLKLHKSNASDFCSQFLYNINLFVDVAVSSTERTSSQNSLISATHTHKYHA